MSTKISLPFTLNHKNDDISVLICINVLKEVGWKNRINTSTAACGSQPKHHWIIVNIASAQYMIKMHEV